MLPLVALDDAIGIMIFAVMLSFGVSLLGVSGGTNMVHMIWEPVKEIGLSIGIGIILGFILVTLARKFNRDDDKVLLMMTIGIVIAAIGIGQVVHGYRLLLAVSQDLRKSLFSHLQFRGFANSALLPTPS